MRKSGIGTNRADLVLRRQTLRRLVPETLGAVVGQGRPSTTGTLDRDMEDQGVP